MECGSVALAAAGVANVVNNLPAFLASLPVIDGGGCAVWPVLLGVNAGPGLAMSGSLSTLLWASIMRRGGYPISVRCFARLGATVIMPAFLAAAASLAAVIALGGC